MPSPTYQKKITPKSPKIDIVAGSEGQIATKDNPLIAWLVIPPVDDAQRLANENFARSVVKSLGASQLLFRHCDHFSSRALDLNKVQWWFITDWHITVYMEIDGQFLQGDIYFYIDESGTFVLLPDELRLDVGGLGIELHPHVEKGPRSQRDPRFGYLSQAMRLACAIATNRRHWYVPKRKRSDWNPTHCGQENEEPADSIRVAACNQATPDIHVPHVSATMLFTVLGVLERRLAFGISMPCKQNRRRDSMTRRSSLKHSVSCLLANDTQTEHQSASPQDAVFLPAKHQGNIQPTALELEKTNQSTVIRISDNHGTSDFTKIQEQNSRNASQRDVTVLFLKHHGNDQPIDQEPAKIKQSTILQISDHNALLDPSKIRENTQRIGPDRKCKRERGLDYKPPIHKPQSFEEWKLSRGIPFKVTTANPKTSTVILPAASWVNVASTNHRQPEQAEIQSNKQEKEEWKLSRRIPLNVATAKLRPSSGVPSAASCVKVVDTSHHRPEQEEARCNRNFSRGISFKMTTANSISFPATFPATSYIKVAATKHCQPEQAEALANEQQKEAGHNREDTETRTENIISENTLAALPSVKVVSVTDAEGWTEVVNTCRRGRRQVKK